MSGSSAAPPAPNYQPLAEASQKSAELYQQTMKDQLDWAKKQYADNKPWSDDVRKKLTATLDKNTTESDEQLARYKKLYHPLEEQTLNDAKNWDSPERKALMRGRATANVDQQFDAADQSATRELESFGVDPSSSRFAALNTGAKLTRAAATAAAANNSDVQLDQQGQALRMGALQSGKGQQATALGFQQAGTGAGATGVGLGNSTTATAAGSLGNPLGWAGATTGAIGTWGNVLNQGYQNQMSQWNAGQQQDSSGGASSALGMAAGIGGMMLMSDERAKENIKVVGRTKEGQSIIKFNYIDDPTVHMGLSAQETEKFHPEAVRTGRDGLKRVDYDRALPTSHNYAAGGPVDDTPPGPHAGAASGRFIPREMSPSGGAQTDDVPAVAPGGAVARLNSGEWVMPKRTVEFYGTKGMQAIIDKADKAMGNDQQPPAAPDVQQVPGYALGGPVHHMGVDSAIPQRRLTPMVGRPSYPHVPLETMGLRGAIRRGAAPDHPRARAA